MKVECPHCQTDNKIDYAEHILCQKCEKSFKGYKFRKRKLVSASAALFVGVIGGYKVNDALVDERYPLKVEYAIVDTCVNSARNMVSVRRYENKREVCLCALANTTKSVPYSDYKSDQAVFMTSFQQNAKRCS